MVLKGKRGAIELPLYDIIEVVMAVAVMLTFYNHAIASGKNLEWEKHYLASDIALTIDAAQAVTGNLLYAYVPQSIRDRAKLSGSGQLGVAVTVGSKIVSYAVPALGTAAGTIGSYALGYYLGQSWLVLGLTPLETSQYYFDIANGIVTVGDLKKIDSKTVQGSTASAYFSPSQLQITGSLTNPPFVAITRVNQDIGFIADPMAMQVAFCPVVDTAGTLSQKTIIIDPGDQPVTNNIADMIKALCPSCRVLPQLSLKEKLDQLQQLQPDLIVSLVLGEDPGDKNEENDNSVIALIPIDSSKSSKLGCMISNKLVGVPLFETMRVLPVDIASLPEDSPKMILRQEIPSVMIQIGDSTALSQITAKKAELARAIYDGLRMYYGEFAAPPQQMELFSYQEVHYNKQDGVIVNIPPYGEVVLNPSTVCDPAICEQDFIPGKGVGENSMEIIVIHTTEGGDYRGTRAHFEKLLTDPDPLRRQVASQWILNRDGKLLYIVPENVVVGHTEGINSRSIGIEVSNAEWKCEQICSGRRIIDGTCTPDDCQSPPQLDPQNPDVTFYGQGYSSRKYERFSDEQMKALLKLTAESMIRHDISPNGLIRHLDNSMRRGKGHTDPGPMFNWPQFKENIQSMITQYNQQTRGAPIG
ncbi:N-acetylmuramoyl-L-alanine amidase [Candidatus Woesearchaeota archaeon]|nr:N-acetylmuramoyl-L-alanine amidase [Candidatus Woesearchaeota archaeon]